MLHYQLIARARAAGLTVKEVPLPVPPHGKKTLIQGVETTIVIWPSGLLTIADSTHPITVDGAARYLGLVPRAVE
jgi:hypothetical protein